MFKMAQVSLFSGYEFRLGSIKQLNEQLQQMTAETFWDSATLKATAETYFNSSENETVFEEIKQRAWTDSLSPKASLIFATWIERSTVPLYHCQIPVEETIFLPDFTKSLLEKVGSAFSWKIESAFGKHPFQGFKLNLKSTGGHLTLKEIESMKWLSDTQRKELAGAAPPELLEIAQEDMQTVFKTLKSYLENTPLKSDSQLFLLPLWVRVRDVSREDVKARNLPAILGLTPIN